MTHQAKAERVILNALDKINAARLSVSIRCLAEHHLAPSAMDVAFGEADPPQHSWPASAIPATECTLNSASA